MLAFRNKYANNVYKYLYRNDGQTILINDIADATGYCRQTVSKYLKWMERREIIKRSGKRINLLPQ